MQLHQIRMDNADYHYIAKLLKDRVKYASMEIRHSTYTVEASLAQDALRVELRQLDRLLRDTFVSI